MTAAIAQQQEAALRPLKWTALVGYGLGDFGCNLAFTLGSTFLLYYYTDVAGLTAAAVGTMFFVVRLWDAFADLFAGRGGGPDHDPLGQVPPVHPLRRRAAAVHELPDLPRADRAGRRGDAALRLPHLRRPRPAVLAGQHPLRLARLGDDPVGPPAGQARRRPRLRRRRGQRADQLHHRAADLRPAGAEEHPAAGRLPRPGPGHLHQHHPAVHPARLDRLRPDVPVVPREGRPPRRPA